jgi:hypothetical protein
MESLLGTTLPVFIGMTVFVMGFAAFMTGQALANTWQPAWKAAVDGELFLFSGYLIDTAVLIGICLASYRLTQAHRMVTQYPWIYERRGFFGWREKGLR